MDANKFTEKDSEKLVKFLNFVASKMRTKELEVQEVIEFFGLLAFMQKDLKAKVDSNILEVKAVHEPEEKPKRTRKSKASN